MVEKVKRAPGRPRAFDVDQALGKAMRLFWAQGYDGTSLDDLEAAMEIGRPSMYRAFGDKRTLFMKCLAHYSDNVAGASVRLLDAHVEIRQAMVAFYGQAVGNVCEDGIGCMVGCVATSVADPEVKDFLRVSSAVVEAALEARFRKAVEEGQLRADFPVACRARRGFDALIALGFRGRSGADRETLLHDAQETAELILS